MCLAGRHDWSMYQDLLHERTMSSGLSDNMSVSNEEKRASDAAGREQFKPNDVKSKASRWPTSSKNYCGHCLESG